MSHFNVASLSRVSNHSCIHFSWNIDSQKSHYDQHTSMFNPMNYFFSFKQICATFVTFENKKKNHDEVLTIYDVL